MKEKALEFLKKALMPHPVALVILCALSGGALYYVFLRGIDKSFAAYFVYVFSFYTLCVSVFSVVLGLRRFDVKGILSDKSPFLRRYFEDRSFHFFLNFSSAIPLNIAYAVFKIVYGINIRSDWTVENGVYYVFLTVLRVLIVAGAIRGGEQEKKVVKISSAIISFLSLLYFFMVLEMYFNSRSPHYPGYVVYAAALYSFIKLGTAIRWCVKTRNIKSVSVSAGNTLKLANAFVSLIFLESGMLNIFGEGSKDEKTLIFVSGSVVAVYLFVSGLFMFSLVKKKWTGIRKSWV